MAFFNESVQDKGEYYVVYCDLTNQPVTDENAHTMYEFIADVRRLPKKFEFVLDARPASLFNFLPFLPQILFEAKKGGVSKCISTSIIVPANGPMASLMPFLNSVAHLTKIELLPC